MSKSQSVNKTTTVCINTDKTIKEIKIPSNLNIDRLDFNKIRDFKVNKDNIFERECDYDWNDTIISIYASSDGKAGTENQYDLPPPIDSQLYFGNILVVCHTDKTVSNLSKDDFNKFYEDAMGGFESLGEEDSYSEEEEPNSDDSINDFIVNDSDEIAIEGDSSSEPECSDSESGLGEQSELLSTGDSSKIVNNESEDENEDEDEDYEEESEEDTVSNSGSNKGNNESDEGGEGNEGNEGDNGSDEGNGVGSGEDRGDGNEGSEIEGKDKKDIDGQNSTLKNIKDDTS